MQNNYVIGDIGTQLVHFLYKLICVMSDSIQQSIQEWFYKQFTQKSPMFVFSDSMFFILF